jgi:hypothetical protein
MVASISWLIDSTLILLPSLHNLVPCASVSLYGLLIRILTIHLITILDSRILKSRWRQGHTLSEDSRGELFLSCSNFWWSQAILGFKLHHSDLCPHFTWTFLLCLLPFPCLIRTLVIGFRAYSNPVWYLLEILNLVTSAKVFFPNRV